MEGRKFEALYINFELPLIVGYDLRLNIGISVISRECCWSGRPIGRGVATSREQLKIISRDKNAVLPTSLGNNLTSLSAILDA